MLVDLHARNLLVPLSQPSSHQVGLAPCSVDSVRRGGECVFEADGVPIPIRQSRSSGRKSSGTPNSSRRIGPRPTRWSESIHPQELGGVELPAQHIGVWTASCVVRPTDGLPAAYPRGTRSLSRCAMAAESYRSPAAASGGTACSIRRRSSGVSVRSSAASASLS